MVKVSITRAKDNLYAAVAKALSDIGGRYISAGDHVLIKPNLVEPADPDSGEITSPAVIEAVARYCLGCSAARVIIGEGPSYYQPESYLRDCFTRTGVSKVAERLGIEWVLFDEHDYRTFKGTSDCLPSEFRVTEYAFNCDKFINLPVLKTHYLTTVTLAMKNLKGCLKREDKPRFHSRDLSRAVVELCKIVKPTVNIIDGTTGTIGRQLGIGYDSGKRLDTGLLIASSDIVAVDTVGCALIGIDPSEVRTATLGAEAGLGEGDLTRIDIVGEELKSLKFRVKLPQGELKESFPALEVAGAETACSGCLIPLVSSLRLLRDQGAGLSYPLRICLGKDADIPEGKTCLLVGDCAQVEDSGKLNIVRGCPPRREELMSSLRRHISK